MLIVCKECSYLMTKSEVTGYLTGEVYDFIKQFLLPYLSKRNIVNDSQQMLNDLIVGFINQQKVKCPQCQRFVAWIQENKKD